MRRPGIYGPYQHRRRWKLIVVHEGGGQTAPSYEHKEEAEAAKRALEGKRATLDGVTVTQAIDQYETWQKARGLKPNSYETTRRRLDKFLADVATNTVASITDRKAKSIYEGWVTRAPVDTHRNMLAETKTFISWCVEKGWIKRSPFASVKGVGKKRRGKTQLRFDEARKWYATAFDLAGVEPGAVAAMATFAFGLRASEVAQLAVRDLDDGGRLLWVADSKTEAGKRTLQVPDDLRPLLQQLASGKAATEPLFGPGRTRYWVYYWVQRVCELARVQKVCAHAMRGLHGSTAVEAGATPRLVAAALGHTSPTVTERHYLAPGTTARATQRAALSVISGGK
jgi:integrase